MKINRNSIIEIASWMASIWLLLLFLNKYQVSIPIVQDNPVVIGVVIVVLSVASSVARIFVSRESRIEKLEEMSVGKLTPADERELLIKYEAGYTAFLTLMNIISASIVIVAVFLLLDLDASFAVPLCLLFLAAGAITYFRVLKSRGFELKEKLERDVDQRWGKKK